MAEAAVTFSFEQLMGVATDGYAREANMLANVAASKHFQPLLSRFADYPKFLIEQARDRYGDKAGRLCNTGDMDRELNVAAASELLTELLACAHLAASCYMFNGVAVPSGQFGHQGLSGIAGDLIKRTLGGSARNVRTLLHNLHNIDAIRTIHVLKLAGLLDVQYESCRQLSLGAGHGSRDLASIHQVPVINVQGGQGIPGEPGYSFHSHCPGPKDVVLSDNDPGLTEYFEELNARPGSGVRAMHEDTYQALEKLPEFLSGAKLGLRNLVAVFRIDHRMLPDVPGFFRLLSAVVSDEADFVLSIGAGHSVDEFSGRLEKIAQITDFLNGRGIMTTRFRFYRGESAEQKRNNCIFGAMSYATYELLHCKLDKQVLSA